MQHPLKEPVLRTWFDWTDTNGNERIDSDEALGTFSVMAHEKIGSGGCVVLSDPSIFINSMQDVDEK